MGAMGISDSPDLDLKFFCCELPRGLSPSPPPPFPPPLPPPAPAAAGECPYSEFLHDFPSSVTGRLWDGGPCRPSPCGATVPCHAKTCGAPGSPRDCSCMSPVLPDARVTHENFDGPCCAGGAAPILSAGPGPGGRLGSSRFRPLDVRATAEPDAVVTTFYTEMPHTHTHPVAGRGMRHPFFIIRFSLYSSLFSHTLTLVLPKTPRTRGPSGTHLVGVWA